MSSPSTEGDTGKVKVERLFFALWPSDEVRQALRRNCKSILQHSGGRPVVPDNWHITLAFLGSVDAKQRICVEQVAGRIECPTFNLALDQVGHWSRPRVLWLGCHDIPDVLHGLVAELSQGVRDCGLELDKRPFKAHLTLMRKVARRPAELEIRPLAWQVGRFVLVKSNTLPDGVQYQVVREWPLISSE